MLLPISFPRKSISLWMCWARFEIGYLFIDDTNLLLDTDRDVGRIGGCKSIAMDMKHYGCYECNREEERTRKKREYELLPGCNLDEEKIDSPFSI